MIKRLLKLFKKKPEVKMHDIGPDIVYLHDENGNIIYTKDMSGFETWKEYDGDRLIKFRNSDGYEKIWEYDDIGRLIFIKAPTYKEYIEYLTDNECIHHIYYYDGHTESRYYKDEIMTKYKDSNGVEWCFRD